MAALAYAFGPLSGEYDISPTGEVQGMQLSTALLLLILETQNDYVRFHGEHMSFSLVPFG